MKKFLVQVFGNIYSSLAAFAATLVTGYFLLTLGGVGALAISVDGAKELRPGSVGGFNNAEDVGVMFFVKGPLGSPDAEVSLEVNEISSAKILTGIGTSAPFRNGSTPVVQQRYLRVDGVKTQKFSRSEYFVLGKGSGGKVTGAVMVGTEKAGLGVFLTQVEFYVICFAFLAFGIVAGLTWPHVFVKAKKVPRKQSAARTSTHP